MVTIEILIAAKELLEALDEDFHGCDERTEKAMDALRCALNPSDVQEHHMPDDVVN